MTSASASRVGHYGTIQMLYYYYYDGVRAWMTQHVILIYCESLPLSLTTKVITATLTL